MARMGWWRPFTNENVLFFVLEKHTEKIMNTGNSQGISLESERGHPAKYWKSEGIVASFYFFCDF